MIFPTFSENFDSEKYKKRQFAVDGYFQGLRFLPANMTAQILVVFVILHFCVFFFLISSKF